jgi:glycine cleavage system H protein
MEFPEHYFYSNDHEWLSSLTGEAQVGVSHYAIEQLGDVVHIDLPRVGQEFTEGDVFGTIESTKTVSDLYIPASGTVIAVNQAVVTKPESLQEDPYDGGWLIKIAVKEKPKKVMNCPDYVNFIQDKL